MTDKDLRKLRRQDLLELLVEQSREAARLQSERDDKQTELSQILESYERLKKKLNEKDVQIEKLKGRLDEKDALLNKLKKRLDEKDEMIENLEAEIEKARSGKWKEMDDSEFTSEIITKIKTLF